jgi:hypothetical protein
MNGLASNPDRSYVNPIALKAITWKYFAIYVGWIAVEAICVYFFYPETHGRTLEELSFCKFLSVLVCCALQMAFLEVTNKWNSVRRQIVGRQRCPGGRAAIVL